MFFQCCFVSLIPPWFSTPDQELAEEPRCGLAAVGTVPLIGSSAARCFCRYYGLIMGLISTRWPQRDASSLGWIYGKLSLGGGYFFPPRNIHLGEQRVSVRGSAQPGSCEGWRTIIIVMKLKNDFDWRCAALCLLFSLWFFEGSFTATYFEPELNLVYFAGKSV